MAMIFFKWLKLKLLKFFYLFCWHVDNWLNKLPLTDAGNRQHKLRPSIFIKAVTWIRR